MIDNGTIDKVIRPVSRKHGGRWGRTYCHILFDGKRLSITGVEGPLASGNCLGSCGQIVDHLIAGEYRLAKGWDGRMVGLVHDAWDRWHLNDMRAGCAHQRALGWQNYDDHPSEPCPTCGYEYGSAWLFEEVPSDVLEFLRSLPDSDTKPAWVTGRHLRPQGE